jgi:SnoaL-like protein
MMLAASGHGHDYLAGNRQPAPASNTIGHATKSDQERETTMRDLIEGYLACWNETDPDARRELIAKTWSDDASYVDPLVDARGHDAIDAAIAATQAQFPGHVFTLAGPVDTHHDVARFSWGLGRADDDPLVLGSDVASVGGDGRLARVVGFLDKVPG